MTSSQPSNSEKGTPGAATAYEALHPEIRRWIREQGWTELRKVQADAIEAVLGSERDVLIAASTAAGKTEAAFLPVLTRVASAPSSGLSILYVAPLKALINDQHLRLEQLCDRLGLPLVRWHGDAPQAPKSRLLANPKGVALITPESIEALFLRRAADLGRLFGNCSFIIIDEVHAFLGSTRGTHLASLLRRIDALAGKSARRIGLSATIGDLAMAAAWMRPGCDGAVDIVEAQGGGAELQLQVRGYLVPPHHKAGEPAPSEGQSRDGLLAVSDHLFATLRGTNNLVFGGARKTVETLADDLRRASEAANVPNEFFPHHGNLSKELREELEHRLKNSNLPTTAVCTSTLELGIDIGSVTSVAQVGAPRSIAALRQRLGRSGRRKGVPAILRIYVIENELDADPDPLWEIRPNTIRAVAAVRLLAARFIEPPAPGGGLASALLHQVLSVICQRGGIRADALFRLLCGPGPFSVVPPGLFMQVLRAMGAPTAKLIEQAPDGVLMLGENGERLVISKDFYALFDSPEEWRLVSSGRSLGTIPIANTLVIGNLVLFAGRRWVVQAVDEASHVIEVGVHQGGAVPTFEPTPVEPVHDRLSAEMLSVYHDGAEPPWLDKQAREFLRVARSAFRRHRMNETRIISRGQTTHLMTWRGTTLNSVFATALAAGDLTCEPHDIGVSVFKADRGQVMQVLGSLAGTEAPSAATLSKHVLGLGFGKFDALLPDEILQDFWAMTQASRVALVPELAGGLLATG